MKLKNFLFILIAAVFIACSRPADTIQSEIVPVGEHKFTNLDINLMLATNGVNPSKALILADSLYVSPEKDWVAKQFPPKMSKFLFDYNINHWTKENNDCDKISRAAATYAAILFHNSKNHPNGAGFTFGELFYIKSGLGGHAINIAIVKDGPAYRLMFFEPQLGFEVFPTIEEKGSVFFVRF